MQFSTLALAIESMRLAKAESKNISASYKVNPTWGIVGLSFTETEARQAYNILFPNETLTERKLLSTIAKEIGVPYEVLLSLEASSPSALLASESSASNTSSWSLRMPCA